MRLLPIVVVALAAVLLSSHHASAFSSDPTSGTNADGSPRYVDPDDQIRSLVGGTGSEGGESHLGYDRSSDRRKLSAPEVYPVHVTTRKSFGLMTRKLSVTESQNSAQLRGTFSRRKLSASSAN
jgi:hypothetical protein